MKKKKTLLGSYMGPIKSFNISMSYLTAQAVLQYV